MKGNPNSEADPVLARRARIARWASRGRWIGYLLYALSLALFAAEAATGAHSQAAVAVAAIGLVAGSLVLAPAIIIGYATKAADRADRENDW